MNLLLALLVYCTDHPGHCVHTRDVLQVCGTVAHRVDGEMRKLTELQAGGLKIVITDRCTHA
jgi:hypothetical protein